MAAGNTLKEAITQGSYEILERYATVKIFKAKQPVPTLCTKSIKNPQLLTYIEILSELGISVKVKDFSMGGRFPVIGVLFINHNLENASKLNHDINYTRISIGADFDFENALLRCFTEEVQGFSKEEYQQHESYEKLWRHHPAQEAYSPQREVISPIEYRLFLQQYLTIGDCNFLLENADITDWNKSVFRRTDDFIDDIAQLLDICHKEGSKLLVVDHTHPTLNFPVVRVVMPGISSIFTQIWDEETWKNSVCLDDFFHQLWVPGLVAALRNSMENKPDSFFLEQVKQHLINYPFDYGVLLSSYGLRDINLYTLLSNSIGKQEIFEDFAVLCEIKRGSAT